MNALKLLLFAIAPGVMAYLCGLILIAWPHGSDVFPMVAPNRIPNALAILAEQVWLSGCGLGFIAAGTWYGLKAWWAQ